MHTRKIVLLAVVPIIITAVFVLRFGLNLPFMDQWGVVALLARKYQGALSLADLFSQHNEHRPFFPRLIWLSLAGFTRYNVKAELWINFLIALGTFWFFVKRAMKTWSGMGFSAGPSMIPLMSLLVFNLGQHESWLQGFQTVMFLGVAAVIVGLFLLAEDSGWPAFLLAAGLGVVATFSMASGLLYWFVGLAVLAVSDQHRYQVGRWFLWMLVSAIAIGSFLNHWTSGGTLKPGYAMTHPLEWSLWLVEYLGAPLLRSWYVAWIFGLVSVGLYILILGHAVRTGRWRQTLPYLAIALFVLLMGVSVSGGRMSGGLPQSVVSRYLTVSVWYWMSLLTLLPVLRISSLYRSVLLIGYSLTLVMQMLFGAQSGYSALYLRLFPAYAAIRSGQTVDEAALQAINPQPGMARSQLEFLCQYGLSACAHAP